jgi:hypothetical protein
LSSYRVTQRRAAEEYVLKIEVERATAVLEGKALWRCLRAADMATFDFGRRRESFDSRGNTKEVGELALHVQCPWRITREDDVVVGSRDLYYPADYDESQDVPGDFDWEQHPNRRDKLLVSLFHDGTRELLVKRVEVGAAGSLHILLSDDFCLDVFPADSLSLEHWRLFVPDNDAPHFVLTGRGIES